MEAQVMGSTNWYIVQWNCFLFLCKVITLFLNIPREFVEFARWISDFFIVQYSCHSSDYVSAFSMH